jgi:hypothetical protein
MPAPPSGIFARSPTSCSCEIENEFNASSQARCGLALGGPYWLQYPQNVVCSNRGDGFVSNRCAVGGESLLPLIPMLLISPAGFHRLDTKVDTLGERLFPNLISLCYGVAALCQKSPASRSLLTSGLQGIRRVCAEPHFPPLTLPGPHEDPRLRTRWRNVEVQAATI